MSSVTELEQIIEEIEPARPKVYRLRTRRGVCACGCGEVRSSHPLQRTLQQSLAGGCAKVQSGPRAVALVAVLNKSLGLTVRKTLEARLCVLGILCGLNS